MQWFLSFVSSLEIYCFVWLIYIILQVLQSILCSTFYSNSGLIGSFLSYVCAIENEKWTSNERLISDTFLYSCRKNCKYHNVSKSWELLPYTLSLVTSLARRRRRKTVELTRSSQTKLKSGASSLSLRPPWSPRAFYVNYSIWRSALFSPASTAMGFRSDFIPWIAAFLQSSRQRCVWFNVINWRKWKLNETRNTKARN